MLKEKIAQIEQQLEGRMNHDKKRSWVDISAMSYDVPPAESERKKAKVEEDAQSPPVGEHTSAVFTSFDTGNLTAGLSPALVLSPHFPVPSPMVVDDLLAYSVPREPSSALHSPDTIPTLRCGLCNLVTSCVCPESVAIQETANDTLSGQGPLSDKLGQQPSLAPLDQPTPSIRPPSSISILDNLPPYQAPVPLRRKPGGSSTNPAFPVTPLPPPSISTPKCSGDPDDCMACADDTFGKAFCHAMSHSITPSTSSSDCPGRSRQFDKILMDGCCGDVDKCGSCGIAPSNPSTNWSRGPETIPTDDAWRQLKSHPNVAFADLALLAEVVARRSKCMGPRVVISPAPGSITPERSTTLEHREIVDDSQSILSQEPFHQKQVERCSPPRLVPQDVLIECGRRRMREVNADGVREALRLLDSKFAHARP